MTTITLTEKITVDNKDIQEITLRRPKVRDRLAVDRMGQSDAEKEVALIANLADLPKETIEELDLADYNKIQKVLQDFLLASAPKT